MARTPINITDVNSDGKPDAAYQAGDAANEMSLAPGGGRMLVLINNQDGAAAHDITFVTPKTAQGKAVADATVTVPASGTEVWALPEGEDELFIDRATGQINVNVTSAQLRVKAYRIR